MNKTKDRLEELRCQLLANGYVPLPGQDKRCMLKGWNNVDVSDKLIHTWRRMTSAKTTSLRVEGGLCAIDVDVDHPIASDLAQVMLLTLPKKTREKVQRLERYGKGEKFCWLVRTDELFSRLHTRSWVPPDHKPDDGTHCIEIFGGGYQRTISCFGPHTTEDGKVKVAYRFADETPEDVPLSALVVLTKEQMFAMLDAAETELKVQGFKPVKLSRRGEGEPGRVYDLDESMKFDLDTGARRSFKGLQKMVRKGWRGRCSASFIMRGVKNTSRCIVGATSAGHLSIWEPATGLTHLPEAVEPPDNQKHLDRISERLREHGVERNTPDEEDDAKSTAAKLRDIYAFQPNSRRPVVPIWSTVEDESMTLPNFKTMMEPFSSLDTETRSEKDVNPVDLWVKDNQRLTIMGTQMRPDMPRPTFIDQGHVWVNTYRPPELGDIEDGTYEGGIDLIEQLIPNRKEQVWFYQWLAFKWAHPHIPGPALIMVARDMGTGRGTFAELLKRLFGSRYVVSVPFKVFAGLNTQSQYTDWGREALFAIVNESSAYGEQNKHSARQDIYEHLKEIVEPRPTERLFVRKGEPNVRGLSSATNIINTNNPDVIPLPENDRRFTVLTNGGVRPPEFWRGINDWMERPQNIAAFAQWLEGVDTEGYDPYDIPIMTAAKDEMTAQNRTVLDILLIEALGEMDGYFVPEQVLALMSKLRARDSVELPDRWREIATRDMRKRAYVVRYDNARPVNPMINKKRYQVLHMDREEATQQFSKSTDLLRRLIKRNGDVFGPRKTVPGR